MLVNLLEELDDREIIEVNPQTVKRFQKDYENFFNFDKIFKRFYKPHGEEWNTHEPESRLGTRFVSTGKLRSSELLDAYQREPELEVRVEDLVKNSADLDIVITLVGDAFEFDFCLIPQRSASYALLPNGKALYLSLKEDDKVRQEIYVDVGENRRY